jgi:2'-5' RNA ligase
VRLFFALPAPAPIRLAAGAVVARLTGLGHVGWTRPEHLHLTLRFLGETPADRIPELHERAGGIARELANMGANLELTLAGLGAFPSLREPRVLWLGVVGADLARLAGLAEALDAAAVQLGFPAEARPFRPHLTLGRVRSQRGGADLARALRTEAERESPPVEWVAREFRLMESRPGPGGSEYHVLHAYPLGAEE